MSAATEKHYTPKQVAEMWSMHPSTVRRLFQSKAGVIRIGKKKRGPGRVQMMLRIPESVLNEEHRRMRLAS